MGNDSARFEFIGHALRGDGPFRPSGSSTALVRYPRESEAKFARRNELAFYASPLAQAASRFAGHLSTREPVRDIQHQLYSAIADDADGKGNGIDQLWQQFAIQAKARGSMLLLIDMPPVLADTLADQMARRVAPVWHPIAPEALTSYQIGDDGKFLFAEFSGRYTDPATGDAQDCTWHFDRSTWRATAQGNKVLAEGEHPLGECPLLIFTEGGDFPHFGPFASIADLSKRLFNLDSELDEILRGQTFSLLTLQVPDDSSAEQKLDAAKAAGQTIGTNNLMVHSGSTPEFIAPPDGPATVYMARIADLRARIDEIGLNVGTPAARESGIAMALRFQTINAELSRFAARMEDLERNAWELSRRWLGMTAAPTVQWPREFSMLDVAQEMQVLADMRDTGMPQPVIAAQMRRIVSQQFVGADQPTQDAIQAAIDEMERAEAVPAAGNVVPLRTDPNAELRTELVKALRNG